MDCVGGYWCFYTRALLQVTRRCRIIKRFLSNEPTTTHHRIEAQFIYKHTQEEDRDRGEQKGTSLFNKLRSIDSKRKQDEKL